MKTVPNQNIIIVKKTPCKTNFLQVNNDEWMQAAKDCGQSFNAFKLYMYLAANEVGYEKALSYVAVHKALGMQSTSYYDSIAKLKNLGYLVDIGGNKLEFYSTPFRSSGQEEKNPNSAVTENMENDIHSAVTENSARTEKVEKNPHSARTENSAEAESNNFAFIF